MNDAASERNFTITLKGQQFQAYIGILPEERVSRQRLEIDVSVAVGGNWRSAADPSVPVVDYREVHEISRSEAEGGHTDFLEEIAERIADRVASLDGVRSTRVAVRKPDVPLGRPLSYSEVVVER